MLRCPYSCVLWDVDGTIVDASPGILRRLAAVHIRYGLAPPAREELVHWIGPPMYDSLQERAGMPPAQAAEALAYYRAQGQEDGYTSDVRTYPGVTEIIHDLHAAGVPQITASSKPQEQVDILIDHFGLRPAFLATVGATADERTLATKSDIVGEALRLLRQAGVDVSRPVLVGDRHHDVVGGADHGVPVIFVDWGFSDSSEGDAAAFRAASVPDLRALLQG